MSSQSHDSKDAILKLEEAVDQNGRARYEAVCSGMVNEDATIAPWIDVPVCSHSELLFSGVDLYFLFSISQPTPPPKSAFPEKLSATRSFGFSPKASFTSFISMPGSSVNLLRGSRPSEASQSTLTISEYKRHSTDDAESSKGVAPSISSTNSVEVSKPKLSLLSRLRSRSKINLRSEFEDSESMPSPHRSSHPPVPPLPTKDRPPLPQNSISLPTPATFPPMAKKEKRDKGKTRSKSHRPEEPPIPPPKRSDIGTELDLGLPQGIVVLDEDLMAGIVDFNNPTSSRQPLSSPLTSPVIETSISEPNPLRNHGQFFSDPWKQTAQNFPVNGDLRKVSPTSMVPPLLDQSSSIPSSSSTGCSDSPSSPEQWIPPQSWAVVKPDDAYDRLAYGGATEADGLSSGEELASDDVSSMSAGRWKDERLGVIFRKNTASSATSLMSELRKPAGALVRLPFLEPRATSPYHFRIYRQTGEYHVVALTLSTTVQEFSDKIKSRMSFQDQRIRHNLYLKEQGRGMWCILWTYL